MGVRIDRVQIFRFFNEESEIWKVLARNSPLGNRGLHLPHATFS